MHIVFLNVTGSLGGAERVLLTLLGELRRLRPEWTLTVIVGETGPLTTSVEGVQVLRMPAELSALGDWGATNRFGLLLQIARAVPAVVRYRAALRKRLRDLGPDIVQTNGFKMHILGALACPSNSRLIWHLHDFVSNRSAVKRLLRWCSRRPSAVVAISPAVAEEFKAIREARTIWNAVDLVRFRAVEVESNSELRIGLVATFARWKGHDVFLKALALLPKDLNWRGYVVGGDVYQRSGSQWTESELRAIAGQLGLGSRVEFTGFLTDPAAVVRSMDIVVHASTEPEPFGLVIVEAMVAGRPVVTTSGSIVRDGVDGLVCRPGNAGELARAIERLGRDRSLREAMGRKAAATAAERFRPERMAREFIALYEEVR